MKSLALKHLAGILAFFLAHSLAAASVKPFAMSTQGELFSIHGSNTVGAQLAPALIESYLSAKGAENIQTQFLNSENEFKVQGQANGKTVFITAAAHGSSTGFRSIGNGSAELAMSSRPISTDEAVNLSSQGDMQSFGAEFVIALDGIAVVVHPNNPINNLTVDQVGKIFGGIINNWSELGGPDARIQRFARDTKSGTWETFKNLVLTNKYFLAPSTTRYESNGELSDQVASNRDAIGFVSVASIRNSKAVSISAGNSLGFKPERINVATEDYPLARRLFIYKRPNDENFIIKEFLAFVGSNRGQAIVENIGFISQNPISFTPPASRQGPADYLKVTNDAKRISVNFRFKPGSATLDNKALQDIERIAQFMNTEENKSKKVLLIGFGDTKQTANRAKVLSKLRAISVKAALKDKGINTLPVTGFGAFLPVAEAGNTVKNRRVEVWVKD